MLALRLTPLSLSLSLTLLIHRDVVSCAPGPDKLCLVLEFVENGSIVSVLTPDRGWSALGQELAHGIAKCFKYLHHEQPKPVVSLAKKSLLTRCGELALC